MSSNIEIINSPEVGQEIIAAGYRTNLHDQGNGHPVMLIHGSGPGVTAWANWRYIIPELAGYRRVVAPDMLGFGYSERPSDQLYSKDRWVDHALGVIDELGLDQVDLIGNSFGSSIALALAIRHPKRVRRLILMGSAGVSFQITKGLDDVWGYEPSIEAMRKLLNIFAFNRDLVSDELVRLRYQASIQPNFQKSFAAMFPAPRQRWVDSLASTEADIRGIQHETLVIHGREDRVIPLQTSLTLSEWIDRSQLHVFGRSGHWTQIEHAKRFTLLVNNFLTEADSMVFGENNGTK